MILAGAAVLTLSACGGGSEANDANAMGADNTMMIDPMMDPNTTMDQNAMNAAGTMGANGGANGMVDANTQNMMQRDATTNDPDTNLANGL
jgi:hypothetical protein